MSIYFILLIPIICAALGAMIWRHSITFTEMTISIVISCLLTGLFYSATLYGSTHDYNIVNGMVTGKEKNRVSCSHSYDCNCYTTEDSEGNSTRHCSTCYEHSHDFDWDVSTNIGDFEVSRVDRQGVDMPPRWAQVQIGEPVAFERSYVNYIKASPNSLFNRSQMQAVQQYKAKIPAYPEVYDYHRINRVFTIGVNVPNKNEWNDAIGNMLKRLNPSKQVNFNIIFTNEKSLDYVEAINGSWLGGKKNDVTMIVSTKDGKEIDWVRVLAWSESTSIKSRMRDNIKELGAIDIAKMMPIIERDILTLYKRKSMSEFKYLLSSAELSMTAMICLSILSVIVSMGLSFLFSKPEFDLRFTDMFKKQPL